MSNPKKTHELIRQNEQIVKKSQKHDANLQKNSTLYFQIGLVVCLLAVFGLFEMTFETNIPTVTEIKIDKEDDLYVFNEKIKVFENQVKKTETKKKIVIIEDPIIKEDDSGLDETPDIFTEPEGTDEPQITPDFSDLIDVPESVDVPFKYVEVVPIYPGCEDKKTNEDKRQCMSDKITKLIQRKFDINLASELGLSGKQVIRTQFKIDKTGRVTQIQTRGTHPELEKEAQRIINKIPDMIPGKQRDKNVGVIYSLPILFNVQN